MNFLNDPKIMIGLAVILYSVVLYFYLNYQIGATLKLELAKAKKHKQLKLAKQQQLLKRQQYLQSRHGGHDAQDSYYDPAEDGGIQDDQDDDQDDNMMGNQRLTKDNVLMRDMMGL